MFSDVLNWKPSESPTQQVLQRYSLLRSVFRRYVLLSVFLVEDHGSTSTEKEDSGRFRTRLVSCIFSTSDTAAHHRATARRGPPEYWLRPIKVGRWRAIVCRA